MSSVRDIEAGADVLTVFNSDALSALRQMPDESVQTCVTSPPYWSLRDYGIEPLIWDPLSTPWAPAVCRHEWTAGPAKEAYTGTTRWQHTTNGRGEEQPDEKRLRTSTTRETRPEAWGEVKQGSFCECGAWRGCLGLEPTPELYVQHIVQIFREVRRVLRKDGTLWLNLGDSYAGGGNGGGGSFAKDGIREPLEGTDKNVAGRNGNRGVTVKSKRIARGSGRWGGGNAPAAGDLKAKDLVGIPWMVAFALRADGWYLRSDIIWSKPNPMPESVTDRPTRSHEYVFLLTKSKTYFYDAEAIKEAAADTGRLNGRDGRDEDPRARPPGSRARTLARVDFTQRGRNKRSVWEIPTAPFPEAHFATFPKDLVIPCVLAGSKAGDVVMDPFGGSGTVGKVAIELGRKAILIEPKAEYVEMIERRCRTTIGLPL